MRLAVIGGGINGFSCALQLLEYMKNVCQYDVEIVVITEHLSPETTGDGSAGLWGPFLVGHTQSQLIYKWSKGTHEFLERIWLSPDAAEAGVCLLPVMRVTKNNAHMDLFWRDIVYGCMPLTDQQLSQLNKHQTNKYTSGVQFVTYTSEPVKFLPYLMKRYTSQGGKILQQKVENWQEFITSQDYDVIVNCTGLGSRQMLQDEQVFPIRGQVSRIKANWIYYGVVDESDEGNYIIPNLDTVVLGGTHQEHDFNTMVSQKDKNFIFKGCRDILPGTQNSHHLFDWVGLRPGRTHIRLEATNQDGKIVIHNYGHGGSGVTLAWGCAQEVVQLIKTKLNERQNIKSHL